jgi:hypothetical protein
MDSIAYRPTGTDSGVNPHLEFFALEFPTLSLIPTLSLEV